MITSTTTTTMPQSSPTTNLTTTNTTTQVLNESAAAATFHDFMGTVTTSDDDDLTKPNLGGSFKKPSSSSSLITTTSELLRSSEVISPSSPSVVSMAAAAAGRLSTTSDRACSERQGGNHFEGVPCYGPRSDLSSVELSNRIAGSKRSNSDSAYMGSSRDGMPQIRPDSLENSHLMKILRSRAGGERIRRSNDDDIFYGMQTLRPNSASLILQSSTGNRPDAKWDRRISTNMSPGVQYPPRGVQFSPSMHQVPPHRFRETNVSSPSVISQSAADEGSRTGIKGSGILSSINANGGVLERKSSGALPVANTPKSDFHNLEPESNLTSNRHASRQMTIFYGGQAHVFDEVHPNKADVIMSLAGSNGGSWSTTYSPKSDAKPVGETRIRSGENDTGSGSNLAFIRELRGRSSLIGHTNPGFTFVDGISSPSCNPLSGGNQGGIVGKDSRNTVQSGEPCTTDEKREV